MLKMDKSNSYLELRKFLEDVYIYLNNQTAEQNDDGSFEHIKPTDLINRCKDILNKYEVEQNSNVEQAYLEMNGNNKIDQPCEYVDVTSPVSVTVEVSANDLPASNEQVNVERKVNDVEMNVECPFSGLPAAHLLIKKSPKVGNLQRVKDKTYIFNQSRIKFYCGLLDGWLLMYSNSSDLKPTICLNLQCYDLCNSELFRKREQFQLISNEYKTDYSRSPKKYLLQAASANDYEEWLQAITTATKSSQIRRRLNSTSRKLPSPPPANESKPRLSDRSEGIYEEPSEMFSTQFYQSFQFDNWMQLPVAPALPVKIVTKCKNECHPESAAYDIPKSPPKPTTPNLDHRNKIQHVKTQLTMQMLSPKQIDKMSSTDEEKCKSKKKSKVEASEMPPKFSKRNWFLNRLSGRNVGSSGKLRIENGTLGDIPMSSDPVDSRIDIKRGGKVNMIINQLEANGHFQLRKEKFNDEELHNYEPVAITGCNTK